MTALGMTIRPGPRRRSRLIPLPRGDTGERGTSWSGNIGPPDWSVSLRAAPHCRGSGMLPGTGPPDSTERFPRRSGGLPQPACGRQSLPLNLGGSCAPDLIGTQELSSFGAGLGMTKGQGNSSPTRFVRARETIALEPFRRFQAISKKPFGGSGGHSLTKGASFAAPFRRGSQVHNFHSEGFV